MHRITARMALSLGLLWCVTTSSFAQLSNIYTTEIASYRTGLELYDKLKFGAAFKQFNEAIDQIDNRNSEVSVNAQYYAAVCAMELYHKDAEFLLSRFVEEHPESPWVKHTYFHLGKYNYRKKKWPKVIAWFEKVNIYDLTISELAEYYFKLGYGYFQEGDYKNAGKMFYEIKESDTRYHTPANYYYAHIAYLEGNYETALTYFSRLEKSTAFSRVVPYYISQIHYLQGRNDILLAYAVPLLDSGKLVPKRSAEIARLIGEAYYRKENYEAAIPYLERYEERHYGETREDHYQLGYSYYQVGDYNKALAHLTKVTTEKDSLAQVAMYQMGDCYWHNERSVYAMKAFFSAYELGIDPQITEDALFKYAEISFERAHDPYDQAIKSFLEFIQKYPKSPQIKDAYDYLVHAYLTTKDYDAALNSIESIPNPGERLLAVYQRVAYNRGVTAYKDGWYGRSRDYFLRSQKYPLDRKLYSSSKYWIAEGYYKQGDFEKAAKNYEAYIYSPSAILAGYFNIAHYNMGYAYFKQEDYRLANTWFRKFAAFGSQKDPVRMSDALIRIGDGFYVDGDYSRAMEYYDDAIALDQKPQSDYVRFQKAISLGLVKPARPNDKIAQLEELTTKFKDSRLMDAVEYELGRSYANMDRTEDAISLFDRVVKKYDPNQNRYVKKAMVSMAQTYYNTDRSADAKKVYLNMLDQYNTFDKTREAWSGLKQIFIDEGNVAEWIAMAKESGYYNISVAAEDSAYYAVAADAYFKEEYDVALKSLDFYLEEYEQPLFGLEAHFYRGECLARSKEFQKALADYRYVIDQPSNRFSETSLYTAASIEYRNEEWANAAKHYIALESATESEDRLTEAQFGLMRCAIRLDRNELAIDAADRLLATEGLKEPVFLEAHYVRGKALYAKGDQEAAYKEFLLTSDTAAGAFGAEAQYMVAKVLFDRDDYTNAEKELFELIEEKNTSPLWTAKGLILLSDVYVAGGDLFQARGTLESVVSNFTGDKTVRKEAESKLELIKSMEAQEEEAEEEPDEEILLDDELNYDYWFDNELLDEEEAEAALENNEKRGSE